MVELKPSQVKNIESEIIRKLTVHQALGEVKLMELLSGSENPDLVDINFALARLYQKGMIEIVLDSTQTMKIYRMKQVLH